MAAPTPHWSLPLLDGTEPGVFKTLYNSLSNALEAGLDSFKTAMGWGFLGPYSSLAALNAVTPDHDGQRAVVIGSAMASENGEYVSSGGSWCSKGMIYGSLSWTQGSFTTLSSQGSWPTSNGSSVTGIGRVQTVTFTVPFASTPQINLTLSSGFITNDTPVLTAVSTTGFSATVIRNFNSGHTVAVNWSAVA